MSGPPLFSTLSAITELGVTAAVFLFIYSAYFHDRFRTGLIAFALTYEVLVNVAYMSYRLIAPASGVEYSSAMKGFLAFHGILSLVMLIGLVAMVITAVRWHRHGDNLFQEMPWMTLTFVVLWTVSIVTGEAIYVMTYLL